jgi:hypothetical protein
VTSAIYAMDTSGYCGIIGSGYFFQLRFFSMFQFFILISDIAEQPILAVWIKPTLSPSIYVMGVVHVGSIMAFFIVILVLVSTNTPLLTMFVNE